VGSDSGIKEFSVHEDLICPRSHFFEKALNGAWKESEERKVDLPEDEPEVFALYLKLRYVSTVHISNRVALTFRLQTNTLPIKKSGAPAEAKVIVSREYTSLSKLYVLAEKLMDDKARSFYG
jgi:hypothetical protein